MTLPFFPTPYPDEILYSRFSRYHAWSSNRFHAHTLQDLHGSSKAVATVDLPHRLQHICDQISGGAVETPEQIIARNTLFPFFKPFLPEKRVLKIIECMKETQHRYIHSFVIGARKTINRFLRYCPQCMKEDAQKYGEPYWHRTHQVFGVSVCHKHYTKLCESDIEISILRNRVKFYPLSNKVICKNDFSANDDKYFHHNFEIAKQINWLLNNEVPTIGLEEIRNRYILHLGKRHFLTFAGLVKKKKLFDSLKDFYGREFLSEIGATSLLTNKNWLSSSNIKRLHHPLIHVLFQRFLGLAEGDFWNNEIKDDLPFGEGPWICLNPAAEHYLKPVITDCVIKRNGRAKRIVGQFKCPCGFHYSKFAPAISDSAAHENYRVLEFGPMWKAKLVKIINEEGLGVRAAARIMKTSRKSIKKYLQESKAVNNDFHEDKIEIASVGKRKVYRESFVKIIEGHPKNTRMELRNVNPKIYLWLLNNDRIWLNAQLPARKFHAVYTRQIIDWGKRDNELSVKVLTAAGELIKSQERPVRVTASKIANYLNINLHGQLKKLPKTIEVVKAVTETVEDAQIRRVRYAAIQLKKAGKLPQISSIVKNASLYFGYSKRVAEEIEKVVSNEGQVIA